MYGWTVPQLQPWAPVPLRLIVGYGFLEHGYSKIVHGPESFAAILAAIGVPAPELMSWVTILIELVGGLAVLAGAFVPLVSLPMAAVLLVAALTVHLPNGFSSIKLLAVTAAGAQFGQPGYETDLLYLACLAALVMGGSGPLAIDDLLRKRTEGSAPQAHASQALRSQQMAAARQRRWRLARHRYGGRHPAPPSAGA